MNMVSLRECEKILNRNNKEYGQDEVQKISDFLHELAEVNVDILNETKDYL